MMEPVLQIFQLKAMLRDLIHEMEKSCEKSEQPATKRWYRFFASELDKLLIQFDKKAAE